MKDKPILALNKESGYYEGMLLVQVDAEIFRRLLLRTIEESEGADLTNPQTWTRAIETVGEITHWTGRPHVKVTPVVAMLPGVSVEASPTSSVRGAKPKTRKELMCERLREVAQHTPPYLWSEQCRTPIGDKSLPLKEREDIGRLRYEEQAILKRLREEWQRGELVLDETAAEQEQHYMERAEAQFATKLSTVMDVVNGARNL